MASIESTHTALSLASFVVFVWNGRSACFFLYRPTLADYIMPCRYWTLKIDSLKRGVSYKFMNREMIWHAFTLSNSRVPTTGGTS